MIERPNAERKVSPGLDFIKKSVYQKIKTTQSEILARASEFIKKQNPNLAQIELSQQAMAALEKTELNKLNFKDHIEEYKVAWKKIADNAPSDYEKLLKWMATIVEGLLRYGYGFLKDFSREKDKKKQALIGAAKEKVINSRADMKGKYFPPTLCIEKVIGVGQIKSNLDKALYLIQRRIKKEEDAFGILILTFEGEIVELNKKIINLQQKNIVRLDELNWKGTPENGNLNSEINKNCGEFTLEFKNLSLDILSLKALAEQKSKLIALKTNIQNKVHHYNISNLTKDLKNALDLLHKIRNYSYADLENELQILLTNYAQLQLNEQEERVSAYFKSVEKEYNANLKNADLIMLGTDIPKNISEDWVKINKNVNEQDIHNKQFNELIEDKNNKEVLKNMRASILMLAKDKRENIIQNLKDDPSIPEFNVKEYELGVLAIKIGKLNQPAVFIPNLETIETKLTERAAEVKAKIDEVINIYQQAQEKHNKDLNLIEHIEKGSLYDNIITFHDDLKKEFSYFKIKLDTINSIEPTAILSLKKEIIELKEEVDRQYHKLLKMVAINLNELQDEDKVAYLKLRCDDYINCLLPRSTENAIQIKTMNELKEILENNKETNEQRLAVFHREFSNNANILKPKVPGRVQQIFLEILGVLTFDKHRFTRESELRRKQHQQLTSSTSSLFSCPIQKKQDEAGADVVVNPAKTP